MINNGPVIFSVSILNTMARVRGIRIIYFPWTLAFQTKGSNVKILHTSDWHLGAPVNWKDSWRNTGNEGPWISLFRKYRKEAIIRIVEHAIDNNVETVLVAGDVVDVGDEPNNMHDVMEFLQSMVIEPLRNHGIKVIFTLGSHDTKTHNSTRIIPLLKDRFKEAIELLVPDNSKELQSLVAALSPEEASSFKDMIICQGLTISCDKAPDNDRWIQFKHMDTDINLDDTNQPIYRAFGDAHAIKYGKDKCYYPGTPFARSSASDNSYTDAGPRYCLLCELGNYVQPIRLDVPEVAVFKKIVNRNAWEIFYDRDYKNGTWKRETEYRESVDQILERVLCEKSSVFFVTFVIVKQEQEEFSDTVYHQVLSFVNNNNKKVIGGSRIGIITTMIRH